MHRHPALTITEPYSPQQNGTAERANRTIFTIVRALLLESRLPRNLWPFAAEAAVYIHNWTPRVPTGKAPQTLWTGKEPSIGHMRVFGCAAYVYNTRPKTKLDNRSSTRICVGYTRSPTDVVLSPLMTKKVIHCSCQNDGSKSILPRRNGLALVL